MEICNCLFALAISRCFAAENLSSFIATYIQIISAQHHLKGKDPEKDIVTKKYRSFLGACNFHIKVLMFIAALKFMFPDVKFFFKIAVWLNGLPRLF